MGIWGLIKGEGGGQGELLPRKHAANSIRAMATKVRKIGEGVETTGRAEVRGQVSIRRVARRRDDTKMIVMRATDTANSKTEESEGEPSGRKERLPGTHELPPVLPNRLIIKEGVDYVFLNG